MHGLRLRLPALFAVVTIAVVAAGWAATPAFADQIEFDVCKAPDNTALGNAFTFSVNREGSTSVQTFTILGGQCRDLIVDPGIYDVREDLSSGVWAVTSITGLPFGVLLSSDRKNGTARVDVSNAGGVQVTYTDQKFISLSRVLINNARLISHDPRIDPGPLRHQLEDDLTGFGNPGDPRNKFAALSNLRQFETDVRAAGLPGDLEGQLLSIGDELIAGLGREMLTSPDDVLGALERGVDKAPELEDLHALREQLDGELRAANHEETRCAGLAQFVADIEAASLPAVGGPITGADASDWIEAAQALAARSGCG